MPHAFADLIAERVVSGLKRKSLTICSKWTCACRVMGGASFPGPWTFKYHPWLREMHDSNAEMSVGQKSAQMGYTEWALNTTFFNIDVKGKDVLYVLPSKTPDASDFSAARFDPALELSPHLSKLFSNVKNVGHKRAGSANLYIRGSKARSGLKSVPVGVIVLDEVDEMNQDNIPLAFERASGQREKTVLMISTPTITNFGINKYYQMSTEEHFMFKCPSCSKFTELIFPQCLVITAEELTDRNVENSHYICKECKAKLPHETKHIWLAKGQWQATHNQRSIRGFYIPQMYSSAAAARPAEFATGFLKSLRDPSDETEFYNSKLGVPHVVSGAQVTEEQLDECRQIENYKNGLRNPRNIVTMGVDVGKVIHVHVDEWLIPNQRLSTDLNIESTPRCLLFTTVQHFEELDLLMYRWRVNACTVDINPERRKAYEFACRFWGHIKLCQYGRGVSGKQIHVVKDKTHDVQDEHTITVDRTSWLDLTLGRYKRRAIILPIDINREYKDHIKALVRVYEKDKEGNPIGRYVNANDADHYAHARNYSEIALPFALNLGTSKDITSSVT